jgi:4-amino-4-deoxy-L-arabinose transferase-like glycosyltransferase
LRKYIFILLLVVLGGLCYIPFTGRVNLFDWDEVNFAESAREMIVTGDYQTVQINYEPFWEKPPLFIWMQVASMKVFGVNEFAARFPNAVCGILTLIILFLIGTSLYNEGFGILWAFAYLVSVLPFLYFKSGIIDPWFNLFIFLGLWFMNLWWSRKEWKNGHGHIILSAFFTGLAILTKGPVALLITGIAVLVYLIYTRFKINLRWYHFLEYIFILVLTGGFWFILLMIKGEQQIVVDFFSYQYRLFSTQDAGHGGFMMYHFVVLMIGVFPASVYALRAFTKNKLDRPKQKEFKRWMMILFWVVLILFTIVRTKIIHYSSLCYFPFTYLAAWVLYYHVNGRIRLRWYFHLLIGLIASIYLLAAFIIPGIDDIKTYIVQSGIIKDAFAVGCLQATGGWTGRDYIPFYILLSGLLLYSVFAKIHHRPLALLMIGLTTLCFSYSTILLYTPKIENYVQHTAIEFYQTKIGKDCYMQTIGFKSYANLFYTDKQPPVTPESRNNNWILEGNIDKPTFVILKNYDKKQYFTRYPELYLLYEKNGFVFCSRKPVEPVKQAITP